MKGQLAIRNLLVLDSMQIDDSWYKSDWLGSFLLHRGFWVYHYPIGWLYVHPDGQDGYWFWDHNGTIGGGPKKLAFPWFIVMIPRNGAT